MEKIFGGIGEGYLEMKEALWRGLCLHTAARGKRVPMCDTPSGMLSYTQLFCAMLWRQYTSRMIPRVRNARPSAAGNDFGRGRTMQLFQRGVGRRHVQARSVVTGSYYFMGCHKGIGVIWWLLVACDSSAYQFYVLFMRRGLVALHFLRETPLCSAQARQPSCCHGI